MGEEGSEEGEALLRETGGTLRGAQRHAFGVDTSSRRGFGTSSATPWGNGDGDRDEEVRLCSVWSSFLVLVFFLVFVSRPLLFVPSKQKQVIR